MREECSVVSTKNKQFCFVRLVSEVSNIFHEEPMNPTSQAVCELIFFFSITHNSLNPLNANDVHDLHKTLLSFTGTFSGFYCGCLKGLGRH